MNTRILLLISLICLTMVPVMAVSGDTYGGGSVQLGGSGTAITHITTQATQQTAAMTPVAAPNGSLSIVTTPAGAVVFIDGVQWGVSPVTITDLIPGVHALGLRMDGYAELSVLVTVLSGQTQAYTTTMVPVSTPLPAHPSPTKSPGFGASCGSAALGAALIIGSRRL